MARYAPDKFSGLLATGITINWLSRRVNLLFVVTGIVPLTMRNSRVFSYGGTALLLRLGEWANILNISRYMPQLTERNQELSYVLPHNFRKKRRGI